MTDYADTLRKLIADLRIGVSLCTRLPVAASDPVSDGDVARASWTFPIAGLVIGIAASLVYWLAVRLNVPPQPAAALSLGASLLLTGAMHEDGLADTADALGGKTPEQRLAIMRDSRIGSFGACALVISLLLRWGTIGAIVEPRLVALALILSHLTARACLPAFMHLVPPARSDGLSSHAGSPPWSSVVTAGVLAVLALLLGFGLSGAIVTISMLVLSGLVLARVAARQFGGQTGDVLGAMEQIGEVVVLLVAAVLS